jgi:hypothetical protein
MHLQMILNNPKRSMSQLIYPGTWKAMWMRGNTKSAGHR